MNEAEHVDETGHTVEATGETVSEAKWRALRELELLVPSLDKESVRFQVLSEGERGLLGVGYTPARVLASAPEREKRPGEERPDEGEAARRLRDLLEHVTAAIAAASTWTASIVPPWRPISRPRSSP